MDIQQKTSAIETELLDVIVRNLQEKQMDVQKASELAKAFLAILPLQNQEDLLAKLKTLSDEYTEVKPIYTLEASQDIREKETHAISQMSSALKQGNIEHAISVAKSLQN